MAGAGFDGKMLLIQVITAVVFGLLGDWIREKLTEQGWVIGKILNTNGTIGANNANMCVSPFFPYVVGDELKLQLRKASSTSNVYVCFYEEDGTYVSNSYTATTDAILTVTKTTNTIAKFRFSCNLNNLPNCYVFNNTAGEYIFKGDDYLKELSNDNNLTLGILKNEFIVQDIGDSETKTISQKIVTNLLETNHIYKNSL